MDSHYIFNPGQKKNVRPKPNTNIILQKLVGTPSKYFFIENTLGNSIKGMTFAEHKSFNPYSIIFILRKELSILAASILQAQHTNVFSNYGILGYQIERQRF